MVSKALLKEYFPDTYKERLRLFQKGADLTVLSEIPFVQGNDFSTTTYAVNQFLMKYSIRLKIPICVSNFDIILELCRTGRYATICPRFHIFQILRMNEHLSEAWKLHIFPIKNLDKKLSIDIITHKDARQPLYMLTFIQMLQEFLLKADEQIQDSFHE